MRIVIVCIRILYIAQDVFLQPKWLSIYTWIFDVAPIVQYRVSNRSIRYLFQVRRYVSKDVLVLRSRYRPHARGKTTGPVIIVMCVYTPVYSHSLPAVSGLDFGFRHVIPCESGKVPLNLILRAINKKVCVSETCTHCTQADRQFAMAVIYSVYSHAAPALGARERDGEWRTFASVWSVKNVRHTQTHNWHNR